jgi:hypothetical protein
VLLEQRMDALERLLVQLLNAIQQPAVQGLALRLAVADYFGQPCRVTVDGLLTAAEDSERLAAALAAVIDMNAKPHARAVSLGRALARAGFVPDGAHRGAKVWTLPCECDPRNSQHGPAQ